MTLEKLTKKELISLIGCISHEAQPQEQPQRKLGFIKWEVVK